MITFRVAESQGHALLVASYFTRSGMHYINYISHHVEAHLRFHAQVPHSSAFDQRPFYCHSVHPDLAPAVVNCSLKTNYLLTYLLGLDWPSTLSSPVWAHVSVNRALKKSSNKPLTVYLLLSQLFLFKFTDPRGNFTTAVNKLPPGQYCIQHHLLP